MGAWMLYRYRFPFQRTIGLLIFIPMVIPEVLMGASLLAQFVHLLQAAAWLHDAYYRAYDLLFSLRAGGRSRRGSRA